MTLYIVATVALLIQLNGSVQDTDICQDISESPNLETQVNNDPKEVSTPKEQPPPYVWLAAYAFNQIAKKQEENERKQASVDRQSDDAFAATEHPATS